VVGTDNFNWANLQYAIYLQKQTKKPIFLLGKFDGLNKDLMVDKDHYWLTMDGGNREATYIQTTGGGRTAINRVDAPNTGTEWQSMISLTHWQIKNIAFNLGSVT
jgi:hypothetical protein